MRRTLFLLLCPLFLAGCGSVTTSYDLTFVNVTEETMKHDLILRSMKVIERRADSLKAAVLDQSISTQNAATRITVELSDADAAAILSQELTEPFTLQVMKQVEDGKGEVSVNGHGDFSSTGITEKHLVWADHATDKAGKGAVRLNFTEEGVKLMDTLFKETQGKSIGIFVRDRLISKLNVKAEDITDSIVIRDIPDPQLAEIFADDLNVGLHVTFTPVP